MAAASPLKFHVAEEAGPQVLIPVLETLAAAPAAGLPTRAALEALAAEQYGIPPRPEPIILAGNLGLISPGSRPQLTQLGEAVLRVRPARRADVLHYLLYTGWDAGQPACNPDLWSYRVVGEALWEHPHTSFTSVTKDLVEEVIGRSRTTFADVPGYNPNAVSFSGKSVRGVRRWLEVLNPPVLEEGQFARRASCPAELLMLAVGYMVRATDATLDVDLLLTPERRATICRLALLDPAYLDRLLDWLLPIYPRLLVGGTRTGSYGRFVRLLAFPTVEDVV